MNHTSINSTTSFLGKSYEIINVLLIGYNQDSMYRKIIQAKTIFYRGEAFAFFGRILPRNTGSMFSEGTVGFKSSLRFI